MRRPIYVVSGLPRSGTSMMMRMLAAGGIPPLQDGVRTADEDNLRGYYELEAVKKTRHDPSWLDAAPGKAVKVISQLLFDLPDAHRYRVVFMRRHLDEVLASQRTMLDRRGEQDDAADLEMKQTFVSHLAQVEQLLRDAAHIDALFVSYNRLLAAPRPQIERITAFLDSPLDVAAMAAVVEPALYRQRKE